MYTAPEDQRLHAQVFQCPLAFGAARTSLHFSNADLARPVITANPLLVATHEQVAARRMQEFGQSHATQSVRQLILQALPEGEPTRDNIAAGLRISSRSLQRQLRDEGTSFHDLLDGIRRDLAERYLGNERIRLADAASLLGFSDQSSFTRAVNRWFASPPSKVRSALLGRSA
jgi:AraC-like DNA-binding protein